jgi:hypothetical protein
MQSRLMIRRMLVFLAVYGALSLYWIHTYDFGFYGFDELYVFISFEKATDLEELIKTFLAMHGRHFIPVFKAFFYFEYMLFGPSPAPYHAVSIALYALSALLLWRFILEETGDRMTAFLCAALYATYSIHFMVIGWIFIQTFILALIFIEISLISVQKNRNGTLNFIAAGVCCILASFCMAMGALAWLFTAAYYGARHFTRAGKPHIGETIKRLIPVWISAVITFASYFLVRGKLPGGSFSTIVTDPFAIAKGIAVVIGNNIFMALGFSYLAISQKVPVVALAPAMNFFKIILFILAMSAAFVLLKKLGKPQKAIAITGMLLSWLTAAVVMSASVGYVKNDAFFIADIARYNYFPFFFLLIGLAPFLAAMGRSPKVKLLFVLPVWLFIHYFIYTDFITLKSNNAKIIKSTLSLAEKSVKGNYPIIKESSGDILIINMPMTKPQPLQDFAIFKNGGPSYKDLLYLYKNPDDIVVEYSPGFLLLRRKMTMPADSFDVTPETAQKKKNRRLKVSGTARITVTLEDIAMPRPSPFRHLSFRLKAKAPTTGVLACRPKEGAAEETEFEVRESWAHKLYVLPCPPGEEISISLGPGHYSIKGIKLHH